MPPVVAVTGESKSKNAILVVELMRELKERGYRVAAIKHSAEAPKIGRTVQTGWRDLQAGGEECAISLPGKVVIIKPLPEETGLDEIASLLGEDYDLVLAEGFIRPGVPEVEVHPKSGNARIKTTGKLIAVMTAEPLNTRVRQFPLEDIKALADLLEKAFIAPQSDRLSLSVNDVPVTLSEFPRDFIGRVITAMVTGLKGVSAVKNLRISLRKART
jgi:molybdopterin-guanine dinucleotide biosynthesis protein MobB